MKPYHSRGYLPHIDFDGATQFVTFRLADTLPVSVLNTWRQELLGKSDLERRKELFHRVESYLDAGHGACVLRNPVAANIVVSTLEFAHNNTATVLSFVVMPNHVHAVVVPRDGHSCGDVIGRLKGYAALQINRSLGLPKGRLWQPESYDTIVKDAEHLRRIEEYIEWNPVKSGLCVDPKRWPYSTANEQVWSRFK